MGRIYDVVVERDEDGYFVASVPALRGCHTQARTATQLVGRLREAIEGFLDVSCDRRLQSAGVCRAEVQV